MYNKAMADYAKAIDLSVDGADKAQAYFSRGISHAEQGMYDEAIADFDEAVKLDPQNMEAVHNRAVTAGQQAQVKLETRLRTQNEQVLESLKSDTEELENWAKAQKTIQAKLETVRGRLVWGLFALYVIGLVVIICAVWGESEQPPYHILPWLGALALVSSPLIWWLRVTQQRILRAEVLEQEFHGRAYVEKRIPIFILGEKNETIRHELMQFYIKSWVEAGPSEKILRYHAKKESTPAVHPVQLVLDKAQPTQHPASA